MEYLNETFVEVLRDWAPITVDIQLGETEFIAITVVFIFSILIRQYLLRNQVSNVEIAIAGYKIALAVYNRTVFPQQWARVQNNLGNAYSHRILGDKAQNIELAISAFTNALSVYTHITFPQQWARAQNNLGNAYSHRIQGDKAQNIESAISAFTNSLSVYTRTTFPQDWAKVQNNLGNAYCDRILGDKTQNIESAISAFTNALSVFTRTVFSQDWARAQNNLGTAYFDRIFGDKAQNIELAISAYNNALEVYTRTALPQDWARAQNNLGLAYSHRILGDKAQNIESAISTYNKALSVYTRTAFPQDWAKAQNNLGTAYWNRIQGEKAQNIELATSAYNAALSVYTRTAFPQNNAQTLFNLGLVYQDTQKFPDTYTNFRSAIETVELLRGEIVSGDETKRKQAEEWNRLYRRMVEVCLELEKYTEAIEYIERSKTRNLVETLFSCDRYPKVAVSEELKNQLQQLQQKIEEESRSLEQVEKSHPQNIDSTQLYNFRQQREQLITRIIGFHPIRYDEIKNLLDDETVIIQWYLFKNCFRVFIITRDGEKPKIWQSEPEDLENLTAWWNTDYLHLYSNHKKYWRYVLGEKLTQLAKVLHIQEILALIPSQCQKAILIPHRYLHLLPLHALPLLQDTQNQEYLIDKFPQGVSYAPSCQLLRFTQNRAKIFADFPNQVDTEGFQPTEFSHLFAIQNPTDNLEFSDIEVKNIAGTFQPHNILEKRKATSTALKKRLTSNSFRTTWLHFSCHGYFNFNFPEKSALQLAGSLISPPRFDGETSRYLRLSEQEAIDLEKCLTLEEIFQLSLPNCRLVTLSACETGLVDFTNSSDEYIGLPSGFIRAGAVSVISSLWTIDDFSTSLLMIKFYENLQTLTQNVPLALNKAQQWFRQITQQELLQWLDGKTNMDVQHKQKIKQRLEEHYKPEEQPFKHPGFWAAFCAIGE